jgi:hypothetical protein
VAIASQPMTMAAVVIVPVPVVVAITGRPMTMAAVAQTQSVNVAITGRPMTMAAVLTQAATVDVAITSQSMIMAAVLTQAPTVDVAIASQPMTMAAVAQNQSIDIAISSQPMAMAAVLTQAATFEPETNTLLAALSGTYDDTRKTAINTLIAGLKTDGLWSILDVLCIAGLNSSDSLINWKTPGTFNSSAVNSPAFVADRGFTAASSGSKYINTNYNPTSAAGNYTQNSASMGFYSRNNVSEGSYDMGGASNVSGFASIFSRNGSTAFWRINDSNEESLSNSDSSGLILATRTSSTTRILYRNSSALGSRTQTSGTMPNLNFFVGTLNFSGTPSSISSRQYAMWFMSGGLSGTNVSNFYNRIQTYMTAIGANV